MFNVKLMARDYKKEYARYHSKPKLYPPILHKFPNR